MNGQPWPLAAILGALCVSVVIPAWGNPRSTKEQRKVTQTAYDVTEFGAGAGDAKRDTPAFQRAVDACRKAGGGTVRVPPGRYVLGRVTLKESVTLDLDAGAEVHASTDRADYPPIAGHPDSAYQANVAEGSGNCRYAVIYAYGARSIAVVGRGKLVGDGKSFWTQKNTGPFPAWCSVAPWHYYAAHPFRPMMLLFEECENALVRDITIEDSPVYSGWFAGCRFLRFDGVTVLNDPAGPNTDGFHFSSCRCVHLTDCDFVCGDDCIAIDPNHRGPSSGFTVTGCTFRTTVNVFRIYTGLDTGLVGGKPRGVVSDVSASNCTVEDASGVFNITADGGDIRRLSFSNFSVNMDLRGSAFYLMTQAGGTIADVLFSNMAIRTDGAGTIAGERPGSIRGVTLEGLHCEVCPRTKLYGNGLPDPLPNYGQAHFAPYNLNIRNAADVRVRGTDIRWGEADLADLAQVPGGRPAWSAIECDRVSGLEIEGVACAPYGSGEPAIKLKSVRDAAITRCRAGEGTGTFLGVSGDSGNILLDGNDLTRAGSAVQVDEGIPSQTVIERNNRTASQANVE